MKENKSPYAKLIKTLTIVAGILGVCLSLAKILSNQETEKYRMDRIEATQNEIKEDQKNAELRQDKFDDRIEKSDKGILELRIRLEYLINIVEDSKDE